MLEHESIDRRYTLEEYLALPEGPPYYEFEDGYLIPVKSTHWKHGLFMGRFFAYLDMWCRHNGGFVSQEVGTILSGTRGYIPDIVYLAPQNIDRLKGPRIEGPPDLAVEIFNQEGARRDRVHKFNTYLEYGVEWYWLVDYEEHVFEEYHLDAGAYTRTTGAGAGDEFRPQAVPGLVIPVDDIAR